MDEQKLISTDFRTTYPNEQPVHGSLHQVGDTVWMYRMPGGWETLCPVQDPEVEGKDALTIQLSMHISVDTTPEKAMGYLLRVWNPSASKEAVVGIQTTLTSLFNLVNPGASLSAKECPGDLEVCLNGTTKFFGPLSDVRGVLSQLQGEAPALMFQDKFGVWQWIPKSSITSCSVAVKEEE
jgi:hypothetical protein